MTHFETDNDPFLLYFRARVRAKNYNDIENYFRRRQKLSTIILLSYICYKYYHLIK